MEDLKGKVFGKLTVLGRAPNNYRGDSCWFTTCQCGGKTTSKSHHLRNGLAKSCGCARIGRRSTHLKSKTSEYRAWQAMHQRCENPLSKAYGHYGGRGITVSSQWSNFEEFFEDMGCKPTPLHTIERVDNNAGYSKENCCWATRKAQARNHRRNVRVLYAGGEYILGDLMEKFGFKQTVYEWSSLGLLEEKIPGLKILRG